METIIDRYSHLDKQLRNQFELYEQRVARDDTEGGQEEKEESQSSQSSQAMPQVTRNANAASTSGEGLLATRRPSQTTKVPQTSSTSLTPSDASNDGSNDYESATDEEPNNASATLASTNSRPSPEVSDARQPRQQKVANGNKLVQTVNDEHQTAPGNNRRHQLQLRSQPAPQHQRNCNLTRQPQEQRQQGSGLPSLSQQNNLARGKQQRASISSCSSSDSYASYGSGYASGSANSSDHEQKQRQQQRRQQQLQSSTSSEPANASSAAKRATSNLSSLTADINNLSIHSAAPRRVKIQETTGADKKGDNERNDVDLVRGVTPGKRAGEHENGVEEAKEDEEEDDTLDDEDGESQLKQHLSELEQLTDELAKRDIYSTLDNHRRLAPEQTPASRHFSSTTIKPSSSNSSSVLSTGSNISSLSSGINSPPETSATIATGGSAQQVTTNSAQQFKPQQQLQQAATLGTHSSPASSTQNVGADGDAGTDSRSASATPTSYLQQQQHAPPATGFAGSRSLANGPGGSTTSSPPVATRTNLARPENQYNVMPSSANSNNSPPSRSQQQQQSLSSPGKHLGSQESSPSSSSYYHHNLFQWEQLVSKGVTRPLLINDLDFTDLRDEDDCDLLNSTNSASQSGGGSRGVNTRIQTTATGEPLTISIPASAQQAQLDHDSVDSGASTGSPSTRSINDQPSTPASAPPPLPPPPISPWFNTISGSRPQSQFMSSPSPPPYDFGANGGASGQPRDQSPAASTYSSYSRNSVCLTQQTGPGGQQHFSTLQPVGSLRAASSMSSLLFGNGKYAGNKRKKTMKLFWKEVREDRSLLSKLTKKKTIWDEIKPVNVDTQKLEYLFESKAKDLSLSKSRNGLDGISQRKVKITVLDAKRSNAINIGMTKLPPMRTIKSAILKMDSSIMNREGIEKILTTMMPTEEEKSRIIEAQLANPDTPLGTAEQFLLNLASISALEARLKLWAFQLDYAQIEKEVAEPLMDLKQAIGEIENSETFRNILGTLLSIGNFLNCSNAKGFQIDYLEKVPEVKDTVHKHSLLHHLCLFIQEKFDPELSSDLYSEFSAVNRASKVDYTEVAKNLKKMQQDCKASWDHLKIVAKHDGLANLMNTCGATSNQSSSSNDQGHQNQSQGQPKPAGKLNNLSKLSMITTVIGSESSSTVGNSSSSEQPQGPTTKQLKMKVSDFLTDCAERIMVLMVIHRRVMNRFQKLLVYLGCPSHQIKQTQPQQILKIINEFALEYRTKRERVREMLMRKHQCQHHHHHLHNGGGNRWQLNRLRWAGSQQCIDSSSSYNNRPCSTVSSCASSYATTITNCPECRHGNQHNQRPTSPSGLSQISDFSDYLMDQASCCSRQESVTPVLLGNSRRPNSMSVSMLDLQHQHGGHTINGTKEVSPLVNKSLDENEMLARQKDEQMRRLLGDGKSLDGACQDLYQMSHWSTTMARVTRHPPMSHKQRAASIDAPAGDSSATAAEAKEGDDSFDAQFNNSIQSRRQSSYYRYLHQNGGGDVMEDEQNSDEEILQSLVRTVTAKSSHNQLQPNGSHSNRLSSGGDGQLNESSASNGSASSKSAKSKILSRFSCDRKSPILRVIQIALDFA